MKWLIVGQTCVPILFERAFRCAPVWEFGGNPCLALPCLLCGRPPSVPTASTTRLGEPDSGHVAGDVGVLRCSSSSAGWLPRAYIVPALNRLSYCPTPPSVHTMSRFVRPSKYRHVYGNPAKTEVCYQNVRPSNNAWDTNFLAANKQYLSLNWQAGGGGAFAIIPTSRTGKLPDLYPLCRGHSATVLDTAFSPFDDSVVVSAGDDGQLGVWKVEDSVFDVLDMNAKELEAHGGVKDLTPRAKISASSR